MKTTKNLLALVVALAAAEILYIPPAAADYILRAPMNLASGLAPTYVLAATDQSNAPLPNGYAFGTVPVSQSATGTIHVTNTGTGTVTLSGISLTGAAEFTAGSGSGTQCVNGMAMAPNTQCDIYPRFTPSAAGNFSGQLSVAGSNGAAVGIPLTGSGSTTVALNAFDLNSPSNPLTGAVSYGPVIVGQSYQGTGLAAKITNTGTGTAYGLSVAMSGDASFAVGNGGANANPVACSAITSLARGQSCGVYVGFTPAAAGVMNAAYVLTDNSGHSATASVTGTGMVAPTLGALSLPSNLAVGSTITITPPSSNSSGTWTYSSGNSAVATISGSTLTVTGVGNALITANQAASGTYTAANTSATLTVSTPCTGGKVAYYAPGTYTVTPPSGCSTLTVKAWGAGGGAGGNQYSNYDQFGGGGGFAQGTVSGLSASTSLTIVVGQGGTSDTSYSPVLGGGGAGMGSSAYGNWGGGGGGYAGVFLGTPSQQSALVLAGGGGGGNPNRYGGGPGGDSVGRNGGGYGGTGAGNYGSIYGGSGGSQTAGGGGGTADGAPAGSALQGGNGSTSTGTSAGGGGGGYFGGGGGGFYGAGGGGSSYLSSTVTNGSLLAGAGNTVANQNDPDRAQAGYQAGMGGWSNGSRGNPGRVVIQWTQ